MGIQMYQMTEFFLKSQTTYENKNFRNASYDGQDLSDASFVNCDLRGANLSECTLKNTKFKNCLLTDVCFSESDLSHAMFVNCDLIRVDFSEASLEKTYFDDPIIATLNLSAAKKLSQIILRRKHDMAVFSSPPVRIIGLAHDFIFFDTDAKIGKDIKSIDTWLSPKTKKEVPDRLYIELLETLKSSKRTYSKTASF